MGAFIDAIFLKSKSNNNEYERSEVYQFTDNDMSRFENSLLDYCKRLSIHISQDYWPKEGIVNGSCTTLYGKCRFWNVCAVNDQVASVLLKRDFVRKPYDPFHNDE
jgi:hypothetical protein